MAEVFNSEQISCPVTALAIHTLAPNKNYELNLSFEGNSKVFLAATDIQVTNKPILNEVNPQIIHYEDAMTERKEIRLRGLWDSVAGLEPTVLLDGRYSVLARYEASPPKNSMLFVLPELQFDDIFVRIQISQNDGFYFTESINESGNTSFSATSLNLAPKPVIYSL